MKIVIDCDIPFIQGVFEPLAEVVYLPGDRISNCDITDADALVVRTRTRCDEALLGGTKVQFIATATIGFDHIDMNYCASHRIEVATSAGCNARAVLQWVGSVLVGASAEFGWVPRQKRLGVVGVGNVGSLVVRYGKLWGFDVVCCDPVRARAEGGDFISLECLAQTSDIITFHTPLIRSGEDQTLGMADSDFFSLVRPGSLIVNSSRGEVVDEAALIRAIDSNSLSAAVDTWCGEPQIDRTLLDKSLYSTPHIAGYSVQGKAMGTAMAVESLSRFFELPIHSWYPQGVPRSCTKDISWEQMSGSIARYMDIDSQTEQLKSDPCSFESMRSSYNYRSEY